MEEINKNFFSGINKIIFIIVLIFLFNNCLFSQNVLKITDKNTRTDINYEEVKKWQDGSEMTDTKVDNVIYKKEGNKYFRRVIEDALNVKWFGAKGDGITDDTDAFIKMFDYLSKIKRNLRVLIPEGEYIIKRKITITGSNNMPLVSGDGMRNTILNFEKNIDDCCLQFGKSNLNSFNGGIMDLQIKANQKADGIHFYGTSPYAIAWCRFENLYLNNVRNGIVDDNNIVFISSHFFNIHIQNYFGVAMIINGGYNTYNGLHIGQPSGQWRDHLSQNLGMFNLALLVKGGDNSFYDVQCEDQIKIEGGYNTFNSLVIEYIMKGQFYPEIQKTAIQVAGENTVFNKLKLVGFKSKQIDYLMTIFSQNVTIMNAIYEDEGKADQKISYGFSPYAGSSGTMINCKTNTVYGLNNPTFLNETKNWSFINVIGEGNKPFSSIKNEGYKLTTQQRNKLKNPEEGMEIYNLTTKSKEFWNGNEWKSIKTN